MVLFMPLYLPIGAVMVVWGLRNEHNLVINPLGVLLAVIVWPCIMAVSIWIGVERAIKEVRDE